MNNIVLIGMPGCGKSTVGVILAKTLGMDFIDTDLLLCRAEDSRLQRVIEDKGLEYFLLAEGEVGKKLRCTKTVIATGGSMVMCPAAMENLSTDSPVIFIDVSLPELRRRITDITTRGIACAPGETLEDIYRERMPHYLKYADITVPAGGGSVEQTVSKIVTCLEQYAADRK